MISSINPQELSIPFFHSHRDHLSFAYGFVVADTVCSLLGVCKCAWCHARVRRGSQLP